MSADKLRARQQANIRFDTMTSDKNVQKHLKDARDAAMARITAANDKRPIHSYVKYGKFGIEEVGCKSCGQVLRGLVSDPSMSERRTVNGKEVVVERVGMATFAQYTEVTIDFDDGSHHVTLCCRECAKKMTIEEAEWHYAVDMFELDIESNGELRWYLFAERVPIGIRFTVGD